MRLPIFRTPHLGIGLLLALATMGVFLGPDSLLAQPAGVGDGVAGAHGPDASPATTIQPATLTLEAAVGYTLEHNPQLATFRVRRGVAAAELVLARTYPFNPIAQNTVRSAHGPPTAGITNSTPYQFQLTLEVEVRAQRHFRKQAAFAAVSRTEWEIAAQEVAFGLQTVRAFDALLYRQQKLSLNEEFVKLNQQATEQVKQLVDRGTLRSADLILARAEVADVQSQLGQNRTALIAAQRDFYRALGMAEVGAMPHGKMDRPAPAADADAFLEAALNHRPDLFARQAAIAEADSRLRLQLADRFGNPTVGPVYEYNEARTNFVGVQVGVPIPILNHKRGEIHQRKAEATQAALQLRETEVSIRQDVPAAVARVTEATSWVRNYQVQILPELQKSLTDMERLLQQGQPGADVLRVLDIRRKLLRARDGYLDAQLTYTQALAELAQAIGDPALAMGLYPP